MGALLKAEDFLEWNIGLVLTTARILFQRSEIRCVCICVGGGELIFFRFSQRIYHTYILYAHFKPHNNFSPSFWMGILVFSPPQDQSQV